MRDTPTRQARHIQTDDRTPAVDAFEFCLRDQIRLVTRVDAEVADAYGTVDKLGRRVDIKGGGGGASRGLGT